MGEIHYDIDISRDFLVIYEAIIERKPFLIGPHSGVIAGFFHGPLWYYINIPAFVLGGGNPVVMGWFWWLLSVLMLWIVYKVSVYIFDKDTAIFATLLYSANSIANPMDNLKQFFNPYGAVLLSPLLYLLFVKYLKDQKVKYLLLLLLTTGAVIQFQIAYGGPILVILSLLIIFSIVKTKRYKDILSYFVLAVPLSTYGFFEIRHNFLQTKALFTYFLSSQNQDPVSYAFIVNRLSSIFLDTYKMLLPNVKVIPLIAAFIIFGIIIKFRLIKKVEYFIFLYLYFGFWIFIFVFHGWTGNYYWPLLPLLIIIISSFNKIIPKRIFFSLFSALLIWNIYVGLKAIINYPLEITKRGINSWVYNKLLAEYIYNDANEDFGYFIFTPDRWVYNQKYAIIYMQQFNSIKSNSSIKLPLTYLIIVDPPKNRPDIDPVGWRITDIGIPKESAKVARFDVTQIFKYRLNSNEISIPQNPNLMDDTFFR